jgi:hypothetical protein
VQLFYIEQENGSKMEMPFTIQEFLGVFEAYNQFIYPFQFVFFLLAVVAVIFIGRQARYKDKLTSIILSLFWLWMGIVYHLVYFTTINKAAWLFGSLFIVQGLLFFSKGVMTDHLQFRWRADVYGITGAALMLFSLVIYPAVSQLAGHVYPAMPTFGLPCPTTIFTLALLCWADKPHPLSVWIIPLLWSAIGFSAALSLGMYEDMALIVSAVIAIIFLVRKRSVEKRRHAV